MRSRYKEYRNAPGASITLTSKRGEKVDVVEDPKGRLASFLASTSEKSLARSKDSKSFTISVDGRKVGETSFRKKSKDEINLEWLGVKPSERGKGYASAVFESAIAYGKSEGAKKLTLEVPGNAPDARHIYTKNGFKVTKEPTKKEIEEDFFWGGLTVMEYDLTKSSVKHSEEDDELELAFQKTFVKLPDNVSIDVFGEEEPISLRKEDSVATFESDDLSHYGVKGMKWGVKKSGDISSNSARMSKLRKPETDVVVKQKPGQFVRTSGGKRQTASGDAVKVAAARQRAKKSTTDSLTTKQLQDAVSRMQLEQQYHKLVKQTDRRSRGRKFLEKAATVQMSTVTKTADSIRRIVAPALG